jgi:hypothetical protein
MKTHAQTLCQRLAVLKRYAFPVIAAVALTLLLSASVRAGTVTFNDLTDNVTATVAGFGSPSRATFNCPSTGESIAVGTRTFSGEGCIGTITAPSGSSSFTLTGPCDPFLTGCVTFIWASPGGPGTTRDSSQPAADITWTGTTTVDHIKFISDPVPEPASLVLVGGGLLAIAAFRRRRLA